MHAGEGDTTEDACVQSRHSGAGQKHKLNFSKCKCTCWHSGEKLAAGAFGSLPNQWLRRQATGRQEVLWRVSITQPMSSFRFIRRQAPSSTPFNSVSSIFFNLTDVLSNVVTLTDLCFFTSAQCCQSHRLVGKAVCPLSLPAENWTCFIEANPHVHCAHFVVHVQLDHCSISSVSKVRILLIQRNKFPGWDNFLH